MIKLLNPEFHFPVMKRNISISFKNHQKAPENTSHYGSCFFSCSPSTSVWKGLLRVPLKKAVEIIYEMMTSLFIAQFVSWLMIPYQGSRVSIVEKNPPVSCLCRDSRWDAATLCQKSDFCSKIEFNKISHFI